MSTSSGMFRESPQPSFVPPTAEPAPTSVPAKGKVRPKRSAQLNEHDKQLLGYFGSDAVLKAFAERLYIFYKVSSADRETPECQDAVLQAAQMCLRYGMMPGLHIYIAKRKDWLVDTRLRAWIDSANEAAREGRFTYVVDYRELTDEAVRSLTPAEVPYTPGDMGWAARVLRSDHIALYKSVNSPYEPEWCYGFWRHNGYKEYSADSDSWSDWLPDPIWTNRTPADTAKNRATKAALMKQFSLLPLRSAYNPRSLVHRLDEEMAPEPSQDPRDSAPFVQKEINREEDGDIYFA